MTYNHKYRSSFLKVLFRALAGVAQWIEGWPANQRVAGLIPSQGTCLGCGAGPQLRVPKRQPHIDVSLPPFLEKLKKIKVLLRALNSRKTTYCSFSEEAQSINARNAKRYIPVSFF